MVAPLKLDGASGSLKEMTTTEEEYLAYQAGLQFASMSIADIPAVTTTAGGTQSNTGSFADTFYNQAIGTHPGSSLSTGTTTYTLYQNTGGVDETGITRPCKFTTSGTRLDEMDDNGFHEVIDRLLSLIYTNDYPGVYQMGQSAPSADWDVHIAGAFHDTRTDGTDESINIYQRQTYTAPTAVRPIKLNDASGNVKEMSDAEIKFAFGNRARNRVQSIANHIGAYQLRSAAQGVPIAAGTWATKGTAVDTRRVPIDVTYSANYTQVFTATYSANYTTVYTGDYIGDYINPNAINYTSNSTFRSPIYIWRPTSYWLGDFTGDYLGAGPNYTLNSTVAYTGDFIGDYVGDYTGDFIGNYAGETLSLASGTPTINTYTLYVRTA